MRDKDIKRIINNASDGEEYSVNSEDIRNALMERIGKSSNNQEASESKIIEPIVVTAHKEKKYSFAKITASVAAACLGIGIIGAAAYNNGFGLEQLPIYDSDNVSDSLYSENIMAIVQTELTAGTENTTAPNSDKKETPIFEEIQIPVEGTYDHSTDNNPSDYEITLLDGTVVKLINGESYFIGGDNSRMPISKEWDRLYFIGDGNKRDITDQMSADEYFCVSYVHPQTGLTHYLIAGGDLKAKYFGYIELFWLPGDNMRAYAVYKFFTEGMNDYLTGDYDPFNVPNKDWLDNTLKKISDTLKEKYGIYGIIEGSGSFTDYPKFPDKMI